MKTLEQLKKDLLEDGIIDAQEVQELQEVLYADGIIDKDEANFLFELNDAVSGHDNHPSWNQFFVKAITSFLLEDEVSPGEIDDEEAEWLYSKVIGDGKVDGVERELLNHLRKESKTFPQKLESLLK
ncbi:MAG: TerB family tellurite resistance protein [Bacteroidales bacterium]|nr:TerB family tellurite resistance protein [Bacteroidales bacterium]